MPESKEILIYEEIGPWGYNPHRLREDIGGHEGPITVRLNSEGGSVFDGKAIYELLRAHAGGVTTIVDSLAASISSLIAIAGDRVQMADGALMMIHKPWSVSMGDADEFRKQADLLDKVQDQIVKHYEARATVPRETLDAWVNGETWLDAQEALDAGLVDEVTDLEAVAAHCDPTQFRNAPETLTVNPAYLAAKTRRREMLHSFASTVMPPSRAKRQLADRRKQDAEAERSRRSKAKDAMRKRLTAVKALI